MPAFRRIRVGRRRIISYCAGTALLESRARPEPAYHACSHWRFHMRPIRSLFAAFAATIPLVAAPAMAQTALKMNISLAQNSHYGVAIDTFAREVEKRTDGRYHIQSFYSGALGAERESIEALQLGTLDLTMTSTGPVPNFVPDIAILDIPFLFRDS